MTRIPGEREAMERNAEWLCEQIRAVITALTGDQDPRVPKPHRPGIASWDTPVRYGYRLHAQQVLGPPAPGADLVESTRLTLEPAGWNVRVHYDRPGRPTNISARLDEFSMVVSIPESRDRVDVTASTPASALHEAQPAVGPECPRCERELRAMNLGRRQIHNRWWTCSECGWVGTQDPDDDRLSRMRRLEGDCPFCGEEDAWAASESWESQGELLDWVVCLGCGRGNTRRLHRL
ncbi:hypothetical protein [Actinomadura sp. 21ATH]|uniref:hypothetical protein n=1 Tax=Actinomadura sp. 21ATH TaxID=1735444 RepID=UPI0035C0829E